MARVPRPRGGDTAIASGLSDLAPRRRGGAGLRVDAGRELAAQRAGSDVGASGYAVGATRAAAAAAAGAAEHAEFADPVGDVQAGGRVGGGGSGAHRRAGRLADEPGLRGSRRVEGARVRRVALRRARESGGGGGPEPRTGGVGGHDFGRAHG